MRVTSKGQVTIPKEVRDKLGIQPGDDVGFREVGEAVIVERLSEPRDAGRGERQLAEAMKFFAKLRLEGKIVPLGMSVDEYMDLLRGYSEDANDPGFQHYPRPSVPGESLE